LPALISDAICGRRIRTRKGIGMAQKRVALETTGPARKPYTGPTLRPLGVATPEEIALAKNGSEGMALLAQRLRAEGRF
jgi:hypothetical protein